MKGKVKTIVLWIVVVILTLFFAVYQKKTGPTYPVKGKLSVERQTIEYKLPRSYTSGENCPIIIEDKGLIDRGFLFYKRHNTDDPWTKIEFKREGKKLIAYLPTQPPAGKVDYYLKLFRNSKEFTILHKNKSIVLRYKGAVPSYILIPHILFMFISLLFSIRAFFEAFKKNPVYLKTYVILTFATLFIGGAILGPIVQKYAFGAYWTGIPYGYDLTDNKTLIALVGWLVALIMVLKDRMKARKWVIVVFIIMAIVYLIPHSALGSSLDYSKGKVVTGRTE